MRYRSGKYNAKPVCYDGHRFPSKGEGDRYLFLREAAREGRISDLRLQVKYTFSEPIYEMRIGAKGKPVRGKQILSGIAYVADFVYHTLDGREVIEDYKGMETPEFKIKERLMFDRYGLRLYKPKTPCAPIG